VIAPHTGRFARLIGPEHAHELIARACYGDFMCNELLLARLQKITKTQKLPAETRPAGRKGLGARSCCRSRDYPTPEARHLC
jgi:hypothetical protein